MRQDAHAHDELHLSMVVRGNLVETIAGITQRLGAFGVLLKNPGVVHADRYGAEGTAIARLSVTGLGTSDLLDPAAPDLAWAWSRDPGVALPFVRLLRGLSRGNTAVALDHPDLLDLLTRLTERPASPPQAKNPPPWLRRIVERLDEEWHAGLRVRDVAADAGVHPVYLARCVRRWYGHGMAVFLRRNRWRRAAARLTATTDSISHVAHATGYADEAHLCREFRHTVGVPPASLRRLLRSLAQAASHTKVGFADSSR